LKSGGSKKNLTVLVEKEFLSGITPGKIQTRKDKKGDLVGVRHYYLGKERVGGGSG